MTRFTTPRCIRIRYLTQDRGQLIEATGLVGVPNVSSPETLPLLLYLHGTEGLSDACSPSRAPYFGGETFVNAQLIGLLASFGYIVAAPDYIGMKSSGEPSTEVHPYLIGEPTAIGSLDMVRAVQRLVPEVESDLTVGPVVIDGASQGGHAAAFVTRFLPHYAPELDVRGAVFGIPPTNMQAHVNIALGSVSPPTSNTIAWALAADAWYNSDPDGLSSIFVSPYDVDLPPYAMEHCDMDILDGVTQLEQVFTTEVLAAAAQPGLAGYAPWDCMIQEASLSATSVPHLDDVPALFVIGSEDRLVNPQVERDSFVELCSQGYEMQYLECLGA